MQREHIFANALNHIPELGPRRLADLYARFASFERMWHAALSDLGLALHNDALARAVAEKRRAINPEREYERARSRNITIILKTDPAYPSHLRDLPDSPALLYIEGALQAFTLPALAVVGTRSPTPYGREACRALVGPVAAAGIPIISGLAVGIDAEAHKTALTESGYTIGVLGSGIARDALYPTQNKRLADEIIAHGGALISEYPPFFKAATWTFPMRNRIIAGLSAAVLVVEAKEKSGTRITANYAAEYGRDVLAVPGAIFSANSWTPHSLIRDGAAAVTSAHEVFDALGLQRPTVASAVANVSPDEQTILALLEHEPRSANDLARGCAIGIGAIQHILAHFEIRGMVRNMGNGVYRKVS